MELLEAVCIATVLIVITTAVATALAVTLLRDLLHFLGKPHE